MADKRSRSDSPKSGENTNTAQPVSARVTDGAKRPYLIIIGGAHVGELHKIGKARTVVGRGESADIRVLDDGISREHVELLVEGERVSVRDLGSTNGTFRNGARVDTAEMIADGDKISLGSTTILKFTYQDGIDEAYEQRLYRSAVCDELTQALKREFFLERLEGEVAFSLRHAAPLALILWDLDRFKAVNDQYGHPAGDTVLAATARAVTAVIRREDVLGRYGGEEFALACRAARPDGALRTAERLRRAIEKTSVDVGSASVQVTASFGVAMCPSNGDFEPVRSHRRRGRRDVPGEGVGKKPRRGGRPEALSSGLGRLPERCRRGPAPRSDCGLRRGRSRPPSTGRAPGSASPRRRARPRAPARATPVPPRARARPHPGRGRPVPRVPTAEVFWSSLLSGLHCRSLVRYASPSPCTNAVARSEFPQRQFFAPFRPAARQRIAGRAGGPSWPGLRPRR